MAKKLRKKLAKKVLAGKLTVDEARAKLGRTVTQKATAKANLNLALDAVTSPEELAKVLAARQQVTKSVKPMTVKSAKKPLATEQEIADPGQRALINAVRQQIRTQVAPYLPAQQSVNPLAEGYRPPGGPANKARTYRTPSQFANSDDASEREAGANLAYKSASQRAADTYAQQFFRHSMAKSDNPAEREAAQKTLNPAFFVPEEKYRHVMIGSADGQLRDAGTGELITGKDLGGGDLPDASSLLRDEFMGGWESLKSAFGAGYDGGYRKEN